MRDIITAVTEIALACGFSGAGYYADPSEYRSTLEEKGGNTVGIRRWTYESNTLPSLWVTLSYALTFAVNKRLSRLRTARYSPRI